MLLAIDIRNRVIRFGLNESGAWKKIRSLGALPGRTSDEYTLLMGQFLADTPAVEPITVDSVWISSVVPSLTPLLATSVQALFGRDAHVVGPGVKTGIKIRTDMPSEVGSDLICAAAAGRELTRSAFIVADFGLAVTFSAVNQAGEFLGAAIVPGPEACAETLRLQAVQIPEVKLEFPSRAIGRSTGESVRSGLLIGYEGLILHLFETMEDELRQQGAEAVDIFGTGTAAGSVASIGMEFLNRLGRGSFQPNLVLDGIAAIAAKAAKAATAS
jgi:type III pantothenate kinase